jgi:hypothetical protein
VVAVGPTVEPADNEPSAVVENAHFTPCARRSAVILAGAAATQNRQSTMGASATWASPSRGPTYRCPQRAKHLLAPGTLPQDEVGCAGTHFVNPKFGRWRPIAPTLTNPPMPNPICQSWVAFGAPRAHRRTVEHAGGAAPRRRSGHALALLASLPSCFSCCAPGRRGRGLLQSHSIRSSLSMSLGTRARRRGRQLRPRSQAPRHA